MSVWHETINLTHVWNHDDPWEEVRDKVIPIIKASKWYTWNSALEDIVYRLEYADDIEDFDYTWDELYDLADRDRVWIGTS